MTKRNKLVLSPHVAFTAVYPLKDHPVTIQLSWYYIIPGLVLCFTTVKNDPILNQSRFCFVTSLYTWSYLLNSLKPDGAKMGTLYPMSKLAAH